MTVESAQWITAPDDPAFPGTILAVIDGQELWVPDDPGNLQRQEIAEWEAEGNTIAPYVAPPPPPYTIPASLPWVRMTGPEADEVSAAIDAAPARTRSIINSATVFVEGTDPFTLFHDLIAATLTPARADEIMAPA